MAGSLLKIRIKSILGRCALALFAVLLVSVPLADNAAMQSSPDADSPAFGHAQVVTQGILETTGEPLVWRLVERTARPKAEAIPARKVNGFVIAHEEPILVSEIDDTGITNIARLAADEALMV